MKEIVKGAKSFLDTLCVALGSWFQGQAQSWTEAKQQAQVMREAKAVTDSLLLDTAGNPVEEVPAVTPLGHLVSGLFNLALIALIVYLMYEVLMGLMGIVPFVLLLFVALIVGSFTSSKSNFAM